MSTETQAAFGALLKAHRLAAGLTQEALAERAGVSRRSVQALEHDENTPQRHTLQRLLVALDLPAEERARLQAAAPPARRRPRTGTATASQQAPLLLPVTPLLGRAREVAALTALLRGPNTRLLTLSGIGGIGKTRLALAVAAELRAHVAHGVWLVELAALTDPALVSRAVAATLGLTEQPGASVLGTLCAHLRSRHALLLLDNCEHVVAECAHLCAELLPRCPDLRILATSREVLGVGGERIFPVPPLAVPPLAVPPLAVPPVPAAPPTRAALSSYGAVALFVERATAVAPHFALTGANAAAVVELVQRLDGLPLAIELAAARTPVLAVEQIVTRLDDRFRLLTSGSRSAPARHQTLRAALDWSYALLSAGEQALLRRLSVCAGGCFLAAAEAVGAGNGVAESGVLDLLSGLVARSLLQVEEVAGAARYGLLETVRQYAAEQLAAAGQEEASGARDRHLGWCLALAEEAAPRLTGPDQRAWLDALEREHGNLRAALRWALSSGQEPAQWERAWPRNERAQASMVQSPQRNRTAAPGPAGERATAGLRLAAALWRFWYMRGYPSEGGAWLEAALDQTATADPAARATALNGAGNLAFVQGASARAQALYEESLTLSRILENKHGIATALNGLGLAAESHGDHRQAQELHGESLAVQRELGDTRAIASSLTNLGLLAIRQGDLPRAWTLFDEGLALARQLGDTGGIAMVLNNLGMVAYDLGDYGQAQALYEQSLALHREIGDTWCVASTLINLGMTLYTQGDDARALALFREGLALAQTIEATGEIAEGLEMLARVAVAHNQVMRAARLLGAATTWRADRDAPLHRTHQVTYERTVAAVRETLGVEAYAAAWAAGQALPLEQVIAEALADTC